MFRTEIFEQCIVPTNLMQMQEGAPLLFPRQLGQNLRPGMEDGMKKSKRFRENQVSDELKLSVDRTLRNHDRANPCSDSA